MQWIKVSAECTNVKLHHCKFALLLSFCKYLFLLVQMACTFLHKALERLNSADNSEFTR